MKFFSPFHSKHVQAGARFFTYCGWQLPEVYTTEAEEQQCVRQGVGFTEYAFMSHVLVRGPDAAAVLQAAASRDPSSAPPGRARYCLMLKDSGEIAEDVIIFRIAEDCFIVNGRWKSAANGDIFSQKGAKPWLQRCAENRNVVTHEIGLTLFSLQGPRTKEVLGPAADIADLDVFGVTVTEVGGIPAVVARMGFTGEVGYEILVWPESAIELWELIERLGENAGIRPYGINTTKILGLEKGYLGGADFYTRSTPYELGLEWAVDLDGTPFVGKQALLQRRATGMKSKLVGLRAVGKVAVPGYDDRLYHEGTEVGAVTIAAYSPQMNATLARGWVTSPASQPGVVVHAQVDGQPVAFEVADSYRWYDPMDYRLRTTNENQTRRAQTPCIQEAGYVI